ncbi:hypothetical protein B0H10DRAFT_1960154 [Mycena sp. CBHHK59/15]|nr:hypothetical protein B0H10DRAFT_1960154 [Mycena sp. CBHHK59/15]
MYAGDVNSWERARQAERSGRGAIDASTVWSAQAPVTMWWIKICLHSINPHAVGLHGERTQYAVGPAASVKGSAGVSPELASLENLGKSFEIRNICEKIFLKLHAVGPRGERMHHAVVPAASIQGGPRGSPPRQI